MYTLKISVYYNFESYKIKVYDKQYIYKKK